MFYGKTLTTTAAALLLCAALGGGSFLAARQLAMTVYAPPANDTAAVGPLLPLTDAVTASSAEKPAARRVTEIVREAVELLRRSMKEDSPEMDRAILLLAGLSPEEMREATREAEVYREDRPLAGALARALGAAWGEQDPAAALAWLEVFPGAPEWSIGPGAPRIVLGWFGRDGRAAWDWWKACRGQVPSPFPPFWEVSIGDGLGNWARRDPAAATAAVGEIDAPPLLLQGFANQLKQMALKADSPVIEAVLKWENLSMRVDLAVMLAGGNGPSAKGAPERERVFSVINRLCADLPGAMEAAAAPLMWHWAEEAPEKAVEWILNETEPTPVSTRQLLEPALRAWGMHSAAEGWQWVQNKIAADPTQKERFYSALLDSRQVTLPNDGTLADRWLSTEWAEQITSASREARQDFLRYWAGQWLEFAKSQALTPEEALKRLQRRIRIAEVSGYIASAQLGKQALQMAEETAASTAPAPALVPMTDSNPSSQGSPSPSSPDSTPLPR